MARRIGSVPPWRESRSVALLAGILIRPWIKTGGPIRRAQAAREPQKMGSRRGRAPRRLPWTFGVPV